MKNLLILTVLLAAANAQTAERNGRAQPRIEIIIPSNTNLFLRTSPTTFVFRAGNEFSLGSGANARTNLFADRTNVFAGRTNQLNAVGLPNSSFSTPTTSVLIGPVFPGPITNLSPTGRSRGFEGLEPGPVPLVTNAFGQVTNIFGQVTNSLTGSEAPASAVPSTPPNTTPLAPPIAPNIPQPTTPSSSPPNPNAPPATPSSPNPTTPNSTPLAPPNTQSLPPTPPAPAPPPAAPGGTGASTPR